MADLLTILRQMEANGAYSTISTNPLAQFGTPQNRFVGAEILPERSVPLNLFRERQVRYRTPVANDAPRYSPPQKKAGLGLVGEFLVELGTQNIAVEMTPEEFDDVVARSQSGDELGVREFINRWVDTNVNLALIYKTEIQRFQALVNASVVRVGDNGFGETIAIPNPAGHRVAAGGDWTSDAYDPFDDITAQHQLLASKGYKTSRIITSTDVVSTLARNAKVAARTGSLQVVDGSLVSVGGFANVNSINQMLQSNGLPVIETYDQTYRNDDGDPVPFLPAGTMLFVAQGGQAPYSFEFEGVNSPRITPLGYTAIGRVAGQSASRRQINVGLFTNHPPRVEAEGIQESLPVITEPEAIAVIHTIETA